MKHIEVLNVKIGLTLVSIPGFEANYCIKRNLIAIEESIKPLIEMEKENNAIIKDYNDAHRALRKLHATVLGEVKYKIENNTQIFDIPKSAIPQYEADLKELKKKHKKPLDAFYKKSEEYAKFLTDVESDFKVIPLKKELVPEDISKENFDRLWPLIEDQLK